MCIIYNLFMKTKNRYNKRNRKSGTRKRSNKRGSKKWESAIKVAQNTLKKTGSLEKAQLALKRQALFNARKLFGSI